MNKINCSICNKEISKNELPKYSFIRDNTGLLIPENENTIGEAICLSSGKWVCDKCKSKLNSIYLKKLKEKFEKRNDFFNNRKKELENIFKKQIEHLNELEKECDNIENEIKNINSILELKHHMFETLSSIGYNEFSFFSDLYYIFINELKNNRYKYDISYQCPKCNSKNINQYRQPTGKIWCNDCGFKLNNKENIENNLFIVFKLKKEYIRDE
jgi:ribosomal protein L37AE/L43A